MSQELGSQAPTASRHFRQVPLSILVTMSCLIVHVESLANIPMQQGFTAL